MRHIIAFLPILMLGCTSSEHNGFDHQSSEDAGSSFDKPNDFDASCVNCAVNDAGVGITSNDDAGLVLDPNCSQKTNKCHDGQGCQVNEDCISNLCRFDHVCTSEKSCINYFGGLTCGEKEVGEANAVHESCCKSLPVPGFYDRVHKDKTVYLDKYEITAGRIRTFIQAITNELGKPDLKTWIANHRTPYWNSIWEDYLPTDVEGGTIIINRMLLGDPRHLNDPNPGPGVVPVPPTDQPVNLGINYQFGGKVYLDTHGNNCGTYKDSYGFPTYYYPPEVMTKNGEVPRANALGYNGESIPAQEWLDTKSMNCITNVMLEAFCVWDTNGQGGLMTADLFDFITKTPIRPLQDAGCGIQVDNHSNLLGNNFTGTIQTGGICPPVSAINFTWDAGDVLPVPGSSLNNHRYHYPDLGDSTNDKSWQIGSPGRMKDDAVYLPNSIEPFMDLAGNLTEQVYDDNYGKFSIRGRGIGSGSLHSDLNTTMMPGETILRLERAEMKSALAGGRCFRLK